MSARPGTLVLIVGAAAAILYAAEPWSKNSAQWTPEDAQRVLTASPWAKAAMASFGTDESREPPPPGPMQGAAPQAGMAGPRGVTDGKWDGGVGRMNRGGVPSLPVTVRWDSALPVREALRLQPNAPLPYSEAEAHKDYVIAVIGLIPAGRYRAAGQLPTKSQSEDGDSASGPSDPEQMLEGLMAESRLWPRERKPLTPEDAKLDAASGTLYLFFPRAEALSPKDRDILFKTRFGSMTIQKQFHLKDMMYQGKLEL